VNQVTFIGQQKSQPRATKKCYLSARSKTPSLKREGPPRTKGDGLSRFGQRKGNAESLVGRNGRAELVKRGGSTLRSWMIAVPVILKLKNEGRTYSISPVRSVVHQKSSRKGGKGPAIVTGGVVSGPELMCRGKGRISP